MVGGAGPNSRAELLINEILFHPPVGDTTNEYVELRGTPNLVLDNGTYLLSVEGDAEDNPGTIQNIFDLSGRQIGQNGFLVILQKFHRYKPNIYSTVVTNSDGDGGWGNGSSSSVRHRGENNQVELENASCTFFLIQSPVPPAIGDDIDGNDDGTPGGTYANWTVFDAVGILDANDDDDIAYGRINFRWNQPPGDEASAPDPVVPVPFSADYVARNGNTSDWSPTNWVASDNLRGTAPRLFLGGNSSSTGTNTWPSKRAKAALNHVGAPNFKAPAIPSVIIRPSGTNTLVKEGISKDYYLLNLSLRPTGAVTVRISAELPAEVSTDGGRTYDVERDLILTSTSAKKIYVRSPDDGAAGPSQRTVLITHSVVSTLDPRYPTDTLIRPMPVTILDTNVVRLTEAKVNPPGANDGPFEFVELKGPPNKPLTNLWLLALQGNDSPDPGRADLAVNLNGQRFGTNGLLIVAAPGNPYTFAPGTTVVLAPSLSTTAGKLDNESISILLVGTRQSITEGSDLDAGDNGVLEGLPADAFIVDAVGWNESGNGDAVYGGVDLTQSGFTPDAASRFPWDLSPRSATAWFVGDLAGTSGSSLDYDAVNVSTNLPPGSVMTPGTLNRKAPRLLPNPLPPLSGVIGDPENETVSFSLSVLKDDQDNFNSDNGGDSYVPATSLSVTVASTNQFVVPNSESNLVLTNLGGGKYRLTIVPTGVGYSEIVIRATDGIYSRLGYVSYAASAPGRPGAKWHTGISDASTAIPIDANWMFVGDDENQTLRIFSRNHSGGPVSAKDFSASLGLIDFYDTGLPKEVDIEASTRVGNRLYWLGSHSHSADTIERTNRARLFATDLSGSGTNAQLKFVAHYDFLKLDLLAWDANNLHGKGANYYGLVDSGAPGKDPKEADGSGFNIEGLCLAPGANNTTNCYVAFRAPLVPPGDRSKALLLPVLNFTRLAAKANGPGTARFGPPIELNLGGRGVRSIEGVGGTNYLLVAGPPGAGDNLPPPGNFKLFTWTGQLLDAPQERTANLSGLNPEGIVEVPPGVWTATNEFQIISDNGTNRYYGDGIEAKFLTVREFKKFRVDTIALGDVANPPAPLIRFVAASADGSTEVTWFANEGTTYRVQEKAGFTGDWTDVAGDIVATDATARKKLPPSPHQQRFFRVIAVP